MPRQHLLATPIPFPSLIRRSAARSNGVLSAAAIYKPQGSCAATACMRHVFESRRSERDQPPLYRNGKVCGVAVLRSTVPSWAELGSRPRAPGKQPAFSPLPAGFRPVIAESHLQNGIRDSVCSYWRALLQTRRAGEVQRQHSSVRIEVPESYCCISQVPSDIKRFRRGGFGLSA